MISFPNAKINLGLNICSKRSDGYHNIESCLYPIPWKDALEIVPAHTFAFSHYGLKIPTKKHQDNLCVKVHNLLKKEFDFPPIHIHLIKSIPIGAGLGGGSANAAFLINMIDEYFQLKLSLPQKKTYALSIGSDCPFFIENQTAIVKGKGEKIQSANINLSGYFLTIKHPNIPISTKDAYANIECQTHNISIRQIMNTPIQKWKDTLFNDFEKSIFKKYPTLQKLKNQLYEQGAIYASMSGSGSAIYGLFTDPPQLKGWKTFTL